MWVAKSVLALVLIAAIAAAFTRPDAQRAEAVLKDQLLVALAKEEIGQGRGAARNLALIGCKLKPDDCYRVVRRKIGSVFTDYGLFTRFHIQGLGKTATCYGVFTHFICPGGLKDA